MSNARVRVMSRSQDRRTPWLVTALMVLTLAVAAAWTAPAQAQGFLDKILGKVTGNNASYDDSLAQQVKARLATDPSIGGLNLTVVAKDGVVTLTGSAGNAGQKELAEKMAKGVAGVRGVNNAISLL